MHAGSPNRLSTYDPLTNSQCAAKSLSQNILAVSPYGSIFYPSPRRSTPGKFLRMSILGEHQKKIVKTAPWFAEPNCACYRAETVTAERR